MASHADSASPPFKTKDIFINLYSINIRGLANRNRGEQALTDLLNGRHNIFYIQETHVYKPAQIDKLNKLWKGQAYWDEGSFNSQGVAILIKDNVPFKINNLQTSGKGQYIILDGIINEHKFRFVNAYFPHSNQERIALIEELHTILPSEATIIMAGDFNFVEDPTLDKQGGQSALAVSTRKAFTALTGEVEIIDLYRNKFPKEKDFTSHRTHFRVKTRIDRICTDRSTCSLVTQVSHVVNTFADHRAATATF